MAVSPLLRLKELRTHVDRGLTEVFAHPVIARIRATAVNPALDRNQLLGIAPVDDPESVLVACARRVCLDVPETLLSQKDVGTGNQTDGVARQRRISVITSRDSIPPDRQ